MPHRPDQRPDDPEIVARLRSLGWKPGQPIPTITRLAAYGVIRRDGRLLLARVTPRNLGGGAVGAARRGVELGESPEAAAVREVEEETWLAARITGTPAIHSDTGEWPFSAGPVRHHQVRFVYPMPIVGGGERNEVAGSSDAFGWFMPRELRALTIGELVERVLRGDALD